MRYIKYLLIVICFFFTNCTCDISKKFPEFRLIKRFSERIKDEEKLTLSGYSVRDFPQKTTQKDPITSYFKLIYVCHKTQADIISLEDARCLLVSITESFLKEINSDLAIRNHLAIYPFTYEGIHLTVFFQDENRVGLGNGGIESANLSSGKMTYERYEIKEYTPPIALGKNFLVHKEDYTMALNLVKSQGCLKEL